jgi:hypothetical protein
MTTTDQPPYGYGKHGRPLWSERDRDAEAIRAVLRRAGCREFTELHGGFAVEGGHQAGEPFYVACADDTAHAGDLARYRPALEAAGYQVTDDPTREDGLLVRRPAGGR